MSELQIFEEIEQGTPAWKAIRCGIPTASAFKVLKANGRSGGESLTRRKYLMQLAGEILTGEPTESYSNGYMERGHRLEGEARSLYEFVTDSECKQVGFIRNGRKGCSPDSLVGESGMLEVKTALPSILIDLILKDEFPPEHRAQTQGQLWVSEREWVDLIVYAKGMPPLIKRAHRDAAYIVDLIGAVAQFNEELDGIVEKIRAYGEAA